eukprot:CAMPEP_0201556706 /NCGR_PEP_ID=MMETSP0173_2-20130828/57304_1 /ASSEMBLY_ACC=CAM_ASM_000268 /TAXON_ID=218659 /ORGANISM="Vexillifera sp., Strain DIVA3 564/2" /LENGTH=413 /DNA_ID=CAMNT_0047969145 /DNA_START=536 /DNA_END=1774 /DNA_ORIENTATION=-
MKHWHLGGAMMHFNKYQPLDEKNNNHSSSSSSSSDSTKLFSTLQWYWRCFDKSFVSALDHENTYLVSSILDEKANGASSSSNTAKSTNTLVELQHNFVPVMHWREARKFVKSKYVGKCGGTMVGSLVLQATSVSITPNTLYLRLLDMTRPKSSSAATALNGSGGAWELLAPTSSAMVMLSVGGETIALEPSRSIVRTFRREDWHDGQESLVSIIFEPLTYGKGTTIKLYHSFIPKRHINEAVTTWNFLWEKLSALPTLPIITKTVSVHRSSMYKVCHRILSSDHLSQLTKSKCVVTPPSKKHPTAFNTIPITIGETWAFNMFGGMAIGKIRLLEHKELERIELIVLWRCHAWPEHHFASTTIIFHQIDLLTEDRDVQFGVMGHSSGRKLTLVKFQHTQVYALGKASQSILQCW